MAKVNIIIISNKLYVRTRRVEEIISAINAPNKFILPKVVFPP